LVTIATHPDHAAILNAGRWELMVRGVENGSALRDLIESSSVVAIGPGLSVNAWGREMWQAVIDVSCPLVVERWVLTPHPGEAARLLGWTSSAVQANRREAIRRLGERYGGSIILKGAGTLIQGKDELVICNAGNPGMASGGMGDVLTGVVAGLIAQGRGPFQAAKEGVCLHAVSGDRAAEKGERGLLATDLLPWLRRLVNGIEC
jgi:NAD(P)H-hydrate epimerase